jgi:hypothetical protein
MLLHTQNAISLPTDMAMYPVNVFESLSVDKQPNQNNLHWVEGRGYHGSQVIY